MRNTNRFAIGIVLAVSPLLSCTNAALAAPPAAPSASVKAGLSPETAALIDQSTAVYQKYKSYQHTAIYSVEQKTKEGVNKQTLKFTLALERPNKFRFASVPNTSVLAVSDGKSFYNYHGETAEYTKNPVGPTYKSINLVDDVMFQPLGTYLIALMLQGDATADKQFTPELKAMKVGPPVMEAGKKWIPLGLSAQGSTMTFYFDAAAHTLGKVVQTAGNGSFTLTETYSDVKVNQPIEASVFKFTAPDKAKMVAKFTDPNAAAEAETKALIAKYEGKPAPDFTAKDLNGKDISLSSLKGKVVVIDFWASWCGPCRAVMPSIQEIHEKYGKDVAVLAVDTWDTKEACLNFLKESSQYTMPVLLDPAADKQGASIASTLYGVHGIPTTIIIDKDGIVRTYAVDVHKKSFYMDSLRSLGIQVAAE